MDEIFTNFTNRCLQAKDVMSKHMVHFPKMSNINIKVTALLHKMKVKSIFYENGTIIKNDLEIIVNSDPSDWVNINEFTINTCLFTNEPCLAIPGARKKSVSVPDPLSVHNRADQL